MGASSETFIALREMEMAEYAPDFSKKDAIATGKKAAKELLDKGEVEPIKALSNAVRLKEVINAFESALKDGIQITESQKENGVEFTLSNTGDRLDYEKDEKYSDLKEKLKAREDLLKLAFKSKDEIYDSEGVRVEKVPVKTFGKQCIRVKF